MAKKKKKMPGLNTSSTADISFMLLIFFLITTSMDTDRGLRRRLPEPPQDEQKQTLDVKQRNLLYVRVNRNNQLSLDDELRGKQYDFDIKDLRSYVKDFVQNADENPKWPEVTVRRFDDPEFLDKNEQLKEILKSNQQLAGKLAGKKFPITSKHIISLQTDRATDYKLYFEIQNELVAAYNELRNKLSGELFNRDYDLLTEEEKIIVRNIYPQNISEAEPKKYSQEEN